MSSTLRVADLWHICRADRRFSSAYEQIVKVSKHVGRTWTYCSIIFFEKLDHSYIVFKSDDMGFRKDTEVGHVGCSS